MSTPVNNEAYQHTHDFVVIHETGEKRTLWVLLLTAVTMVAEILAGSLFGSMALLADGWHMSTHVAAFAITLLAYRCARRHAQNPAFSFGTGKVSVLGGFASAVALAVVALVMAIESLHRLVEPQTIRFNEAMAVAALGLVINIISAFLLKDHHHHDHGDQHGHDHGHHHHGHHDHNLRAAYIHVLADAFTSVLAIVALCSGKYLGWNWLDPIMGLVGAAVISRWSYGLLKETSSILLDKSIDAEIYKEVKTTIEADSDNQVTDLHIWKVGPKDYAVILTIITQTPQEPRYYKELLLDFRHFKHITVEAIPIEGE
ncbi:MAG: CDF family Co(II)/Ni(II) efflux transporter DmeF [Chlorobiales bacterium]|nr:CDF family Co(II)/Ni(II) efflux transporter DmeF [Chlorobiales bacterium]